MSDKERAEKIFFQPFSKKEANAVNHFLGIEAVGALDASCLPERVYLGDFWRTASPILKEHPSNRELYIGWDLVNGQLKIVEVAEGKQRAEIIQEELDDEFSIKFGTVFHHPHLLNFHTHVLGPDRTLDKDRRETILETTPRSSYDDFDDFVLNPREYASIIVDTSLRGKIRVGRVLVALKTTNSWDIGGEETYRWRGLELGLEMWRRAELRGSYKYKTCRQPFCVGKGAKAMIKRLQADEHWSSFTGLAIYRGQLLENPVINPFAIRWDIFYKKLMAMKKKKKWFIF